MQLLLALVICFELQEASFLHLAYQYIPNYFFSHWEKSHKRLLADNDSAFISICISDSGPSCPCQGSYPSSVWSMEMFRESGSAAPCVTLTSEVGTLRSDLIFLPFDGKKC